MKNALLEIEYLYLDELSESKNFGRRTSNMVVYDTSTELGKKIQHALDSIDEDGTDGIDKVISESFGVTDDEVAFYFDRNGIEDENLFLAAQADYDIIINSYGKLKEIKESN